MKGITSPEGIIMLMVAGVFDIVGFFVFALGTWFGIDDYGILEIIGSVIFGLWMASRYSITLQEGMEKVKAEKAKIQREMEGEEELKHQEEEGANEGKQGVPEKEISEKDTAEKQEKGETTATKEQSQDGTKPEKGGAPTKPDASAKGGAKKPLLSTKPTGRGWQSPRDIVKDQAWKLVKKALKRFGLTFLIELIPFLGGFYPGWTIFVWKEMKD